jgi:hypothetical protein
VFPSTESARHVSILLFVFLVNYCSIKNILSGKVSPGEDMELKEIKIARTLGGIFFEENFVFKERSRDWANKLRNELFKLRKEKKLEYKYLLEIDEDGDIEISRQNESRFTIYVSTHRIVLHGGAIDFNEKSYFVNELSSIIGIILRLTDTISLNSMGFELDLAIPFKKEKGIDVVEEIYLRPSFDKLTALGKEVKVSKMKAEVEFTIGPIEHKVTVENSRDNMALLYTLDNRCENPEKYASNYGKFIADVWEYYEQRFWPFARELIEADFVDQDLLSTGEKS